MKSIFFTLLTIFSFSQSANADNFDVMQELVNIPTERYNQLSCHFDNSNRDLCAIEDQRISNARSDLRFYDGSAYDARRAVESTVNSRNQRISDLSCGFSRDNADLCSYEEAALWRVESLMDQIRRDRNDRDRPQRRR